MPCTSARTGLQVAAPVAVLVVLSSCAFEPPRRSALLPGSLGVLSEAQISAASAPTAYDAIWRLRPSAPDDPAPLSDLVANIGPATSRGLMSSSGPSSDYMTWLFMLLVAALVAEVASRRTRGAA